MLKININTNKLLIISTLVMLSKTQTQSLTGKKQKPVEVSAESPEEATYFKFAFLKKKIIDVLLKTAFDCQLSLFGGAIRSMILNEEPNDLDMSYSTPEDKNTFILKISSFFDVSKQDSEYNKGVSESYTLTSKILEQVVIKVDLVPEAMLGVDQDFDVNSLKMTDMQTIKIVPNQKNLDIFNIITNIKNKKFTLLKTFGFCPTRTASTVVESSKYVINYLKIQLRTACMVERGWKCTNLGTVWNTVKSYEQIFDPLLFTDNKKADACSICLCIPKQKYVMEVKCCKKQFCLSCMLDYVKERFNNSEISCPNCRGDPFKLKTINTNKIPSVPTVPASSADWAGDDAIYAPDPYITSIGSGPQWQPRMAPTGWEAGILPRSTLRSADEVSFDYTALYPSSRIIIGNQGSVGPVGVPGVPAG